MIASSASSYDVVPNAEAIFCNSCLVVDSLRSNSIRSCKLGAGRNSSDGGVVVVSSPSSSSSSSTVIVVLVFPTKPNTIHSSSLFFFPSLLLFADGRVGARVVVVVPK